MGEGFWIIVKNYLLLPLKIFEQYYQDIGKVVSAPLEVKDSGTPVLNWWISTARGIIVLVGSIVLVLFALMIPVVLFIKPFYALMGLLWFLAFYPLLIIMAALSVELLALLMNLASDVRSMARNEELIVKALAAIAPGEESDTPSPREETQWSNEEEDEQ